MNICWEDILPIARSHVENSILIMPMRKLFRILGRSDLNTDSGSIGIAIRFAIKFIVSKLYLFSSTFPYFFFLGTIFYLPYFSFFNTIFNANIFMLKLSILMILSVFVLCRNTFLRTLLDIHDDL